MLRNTRSMKKSRRSRSMRCALQTASLAHTAYANPCIGFYYNRYFTPSCSPMRQADIIRLGSGCSQRAIKTKGQETGDGGVL